MGFFPRKKKVYSKSLFGDAFLQSSSKVIVKNSLWANIRLGFSLSDIVDVVYYQIPIVVFFPFKSLKRNNGKTITYFIRLLPIIAYLRADVSILVTILYIICISCILRKNCTNLKYHYLDEEGSIRYNRYKYYLYTIWYF